MTPADWIALSAIAATVVVTAVTLYFSWLFRRRDEEQFEKRQQRDDEIRKQVQQREDELRRRHREDNPHIELAIDCRVHGQVSEHYLAEFILTIQNRGLVDWRFNAIVLRVLGIERDHPLAFWQGNEPRLEFPMTVIDDAAVIPRNLNFIFVEPEVSQTITYVTKISSRIEYILAHVSFEYDEHTPHSTERVFRLSSVSNPT
ncbi:hypothetical protein [Actinomadura sp. 9N215]|uniref:hypothetical protein n=1 Tax=Actinomadura sp. 9N215 TaxID=3375150 RepID=UPI0037B8C718